MKDQVLTIEQVKFLKELGVEFKDTLLYWIHDKQFSVEDFLCTREMCGIYIKEPHKFEITPTPTLQELLEMMPQNIEWHTLLVSKNATAYQNVGWSTMKVFCNEGILINSYNMLCWLAENKLLGKEENK